MSTLVLGAAGAVGYQVVLNLLNEGRSVIAVDINKDIFEFKHIDNLAYYYWDLNQPIYALHNGLMEIKNKFIIDSIINCAAIVDISKSYDEIKNINVNLIKILIEVFPGIPLVHISSGSIYSNNDDPIITEYTKIKTLDEINSSYEHSKIESESIIIKNYSTNPNIIILRPALIYGPKCGFLGAAFAAIGPMVKQLTHATVGFNGGPKTNWVHCEDVARACVWSLNRLWNGNGFNIYNVCDDHAEGIGHTITQYMEASGLNIKYKISFPSQKQLKLIRRFIDNRFTPKMINFPVKEYWKFLKFLYSLEGRLHVSIDKEMMPYLFNDTIFSNEKIKSDGFEFKHKYHYTNIREVVKWYQINNWIP